MDKLTKVISHEVKQIGPESDRVLRFIGSDESIDRDNDIIEASGWELANYLKNPVFLWAHDYDEPPIGRAVNVTIDAVGKRLLFDIKFPTAEEYPFADTIYNLYKGGYLSATSVGFIGIKSKTRDDEAVLELPDWQRGRMYMEQELLELSAVAVPSNPNALQQARSAGINTDIVEKSMSNTKSAIPYKKYPLADEGATWDGPKEVAAASVDDLKIMCAWVDSANSENKGAYKLPHHEQSDKKTVWRAVAASMAALLGARGGVQLPEADRKGAYNHLSKHYDDFGKTAPDFKSYSGTELKAMFPEIKQFDLQNNIGVSEIIDAIEDLVDPMDTEESGVEELYPINYPDGYVIVFKGDDELLLYDYTYNKTNGTASLGINSIPIEEVYLPKSFKPKRKSGASLSAQNRETLTVIHKQLEGCHKDMKQFLDGTMPPEPMMSAGKTVPNIEATIKVELSEEFKRAFEEIKSQMSLLIPKDAPEVEIDLDAIEYVPTPKSAAKDELNIELGVLKNMIAEIINEQLQGGIN